MTSTAVVSLAPADGSPLQQGAFKGGVSTVTPDGPPTTKPIDPRGIRPDGEVNNSQGKRDLRDRGCK